MHNYTHITDSERRNIEQALGSGKSIRWIAKKLGRSPNTVSAEIRRNSVKEMYTRKKANHKARVRRRASKLQCMKVAMDTVLKAYVEAHITDDQSPEGISGRIKHVDTHMQYASSKAIYKFVYSAHGRRLEKHLYRKRVRRKGGRKRDKHTPTSDGRTMIDKRPKKVEKRLEFGHFEGDFIEGSKGGKESLLVLVERKTRHPFVVRAKRRDTAYINTLIANTLAHVPVLSLTLDNDLSFQKHEELSVLVEAVVFFCHPYCSHEKGTVENRNGRIREYVPKRIDIETLSDERIKEIEQILRNRFMKCLGFQTSQEAWDIEVEKWKRKHERARLQALKNTPKGVLLEAR